MNVDDAIRARCSQKVFTERTIRREEIESLLELAILAPNHRMTQPWGFVVLGPDAKRKYGRMRGEAKVRSIEDREVAEVVARKVAGEFEAIPAVVAFTQRRDGRPEVQEEDYASLFMGIQNFLLGAVSAGLGTHVKTGGDLERPAMRTALGVAEGERIVALVHLGEPGEAGAPKPRAPAPERTRWLS